MNTRDKLILQAVKSLESRGLSDQRYKARLKSEIEEIDNQADFDYFNSIYEKKYKFARNENNLLFPFLLGIVDEFDIDRDAEYTQGEFPDIDVDYQPEIQKYLRNEWCPNTFGRDQVVNIGSYNTFGIKSALLDMAKVHGLDKTELQIITKNLEDKDENGKALTWEQALEIAPDLRDYCDRNPDVANATRRIINRNKNRGKHAGGTVISSVKINDFVPIMVDTDGNLVSGWTEGLAEQDLQPVGLIKFDVLGVKDLYRTAHCVNLIKKRHNLSSFCALPGGDDWSDTSYLNDPKAIALANQAKLRGISQFGGQGIRNLVKAGGVDCFEDLAVYTALYRPAAIGMKMHEKYVERKRGREEWESQIPECLGSVLRPTYGVFGYQEQCIRALNIVGGIPLIHCEKVRKAISKKKLELFGKYKEIFLANGVKNTGWPLDPQFEGDLRCVNALWDQIESFAGYGFNKSVLNTTLVPTRTCDGVITKEIQHFVPGDIVFCVNEAGQTVETTVVALHDHGQLPGYEITFDDGYQITCSENHKFLTDRGQVPIKEIYLSHDSVLSSSELDVYAKTKRLEGSMWIDTSKQSEVIQSQKRLYNLCVGNSESKVREFITSSSLWCEMSNEKSFDTSSSIVRRVQEFGVEKCGYQTHYKMWGGVSYLARKRNTSKNLRQMSASKIRKYQKTHGQIERGQFVPGEEEDFLGCGSSDFIPTRNIGLSIGKFEKMARGKSGSICEMYGSGLEESKTVSNGVVASRTTRMGIREDSMWQRSKTSGFCKKEHLDRSGWLLSFLRTQEFYKESTGKNSSQRSNVEQGVRKKKKSNVAQVQHGMFSFLDSSHEVRCSYLDERHAPIENTGHLVRRKIVRIRPVGIQRMYDLEVANPTHNFLLPNGIVTSNSHAVAYTYISSRLLMIKAHYPIEFYCVTLGYEDEEEKLKVFKREAEHSGIKVNRVDLNKSGVNYQIVDDEIYIGFSNIKGVGDTVAEAIVAKQPYSGFEDFLTRFGTDKRVVEAMICLNVFKEAEPWVLMEFYEDYKKRIKSQTDMAKRQMKKREETQAVIRSLLPDDVSQDIVNHETIMDMYINNYLLPEIASSSDIKFDPLSFQANLKKYGKSVDGFETKAKLAAENPFMMSDWKYNGKVKAESWPDQFEHEKRFYGFSWQHQLEKCPGYVGGLSFARFKDDENLVIAGIECLVTKPLMEKMSKKGNKYYLLTVEDEDWNEETIQFWSNDYDRFKEELEYWNEEKNCGHMLRLRVIRPNAGWRSYTFESPPKHERHKIPKNKEDDVRLQVMQ